MEKNRLENAELPSVPSIRAILTVIDQPVETIRRQIQGHIDDHPDLHSKKELLLSIPGIGETTYFHAASLSQPL